jgi:2-polyprenyl-3-methyl-5-hydroxy-6-metoxy-1,4-benzoquinol methylase
MKNIHDANTVSNWNTIWEWAWLTKREWGPRTFLENDQCTRSMLAVLKPYNINSMLDCSCGLGVKTILLAKSGYKIDGADFSPVAIKYAPVLAKENRVSAKYYLSRYEELPKKIKRYYDCVYSDAFDWITDYKYLRAAAKGIYSILDKGGVFIFDGVNKHWTKKHLQKIIAAEWEKRVPFDMVKGTNSKGVPYIKLEIDSKTSEGICEQYVFITSENDRLKIERSSMMNLVKWTWGDYERVLKNVGFTDMVLRKSINKYYIIAKR